ncbi:hypothetical protein Cocul_01001 [Corynebacterium oculi]|uniref:Uncharacterized protein n=1 Tax=Corynebacterium oculi TaxID=1544416 RepID=A0A0Q0YD48_9CORY|nr:hypothetical protein Cocul_01001 [Corynebacterium oculi]
MPHLLRIASSLLVLLSLLVAFPLSHLLDSDLGSAGRQAFLITESSGETSPLDLRDNIVRYAKE